MLTAEGVTCRKGHRELFAGLSLRANRGQWVHVRGANGAGKTTLLRVLAGLSRPDGGEVLWDGEPILRDRSRWHAALLYLGHQTALKDDLTALENLRCASALEGHVLRDEEAMRALHRFGLRGREDLPVRFLSAGQRRRALLARTLTRAADVWVLDEPLAALDTQAVEGFCCVVREHLDRGGLAIVTSHQPLPLPPAQELTL